MMKQNGGVKECIGLKGFASSTIGLFRGCGGKARCSTSRDSYLRKVQAALLGGTPEGSRGRKR